MRVSMFVMFGIVAALSGAVRGEGASSSPRPVPLTRPEMKQSLEDLKTIKPRIPLPELTEEEKSKLDERGASYEGRLRSLYMPAGSSAGRLGGSAGTTKTGSRLGRDQDPKMTLDYAFKTELFWIVSRANNCHY